MDRRTRRKYKIDDKSRSEPQVRRMFQKINRNDLCPCGSDLKFKHCECYSHDKSYYDLKGLEQLESKKSK